jgi:hypothetical protein
VGPQVVHDDNIPWMQRGAEHLLDIHAQHLGISGTFNRHHSLDAVAPSDARIVTFAP